MNKKYIVLLISIFLGISVIFIISRLVNSKKQEIVINETENNSIEISGSLEEPVTDECLNEWEEYNKYLNEKIEEVSSNVGDDATQDIIKDILGYIEVYYLDENKNEYLYKKTTIPTTYLTKEDIERLKKGIEVKGIEELNKRLEDFE